MRRLEVDDDIVDMAHECRGLLEKLDSTGYRVSEVMRMALDNLRTELIEQLEEGVG